MCLAAAVPPSLVSTDSQDESDDAAADAVDNGDSPASALGHDEDEEDGDELPDLVGDGSSDADDLPDLIEDHSHNDAVAIATTNGAEVDAITESLVGNNGGLDMLQAMLQGPGMLVGNQTGTNEDDSSSDLPELEALGHVDNAVNGVGHRFSGHPFSGQHLPASLAEVVAAAASGHHTPLELDQQAALDDLSNNIDDAAALALSITQVCVCSRFVLAAATLTWTTSFCRAHKG